MSKIETNHVAALATRSVAVAERKSNAATVTVTGDVDRRRTGEIVAENMTGHMVSLKFLAVTYRLRASAEYGIATVLLVTSRHRAPARGCAGADFPMPSW